VGEREVGGLGVEESLSSDNAGEVQNGTLLKLTKVRRQVQKDVLLK
jgi:hypothetical protein